MSNISLSEIFKRNFRTRMACVGLNNHELHDETDISISTIINLKYGETKGVKFETIEKIATALSCKPEDFFRLDCEWAGKTTVNNWKDEVVKYG